MKTVIIYAIIFLIFGLIAYLSSRSKNKRVQALQGFAAQNGWVFDHSTAVERFPNSDAYGIFNPGIGYQKSITAMMRRPFDGGEAFVFDYRCRTGSGDNRRGYSSTVFAFITPRLRLPNFSLYPETVFSAFGELFGYNDIDFDSHPLFSQHYKLTGGDVAPLQEFFHPGVLSFFENLQGVCADGGGNALFFYRKHNLIPPEGLNAAISEAEKVYGLFRR